MDHVSPLELLVLVGVLVAAALVRAYGRITDDELESWADAHALELSEESRPIVERYLRRSRVCRAWGAIAGLLAPTVVRPLLGEPVHVAGVGAYETTPAELGLVFVGYLAGALWAELLVARPLGHPRRAAALLPRELDDYLPRGIVWLQRGLAAGAAVALLASASPLVDPGPGVVLPTWGAAAGMAAVVVACAAGLERLERWIVRRPQPVTSASQLAADDAIRAQSVHAVAGAGVAFLLFAFGLVAYVLVAMSSLDLLRDTLWVPGALALLAFAACRHYGDRAWRVRRGGAGPGGAASA